MSNFISNTVNSVIEKSKNLLDVEAYTNNKRKRIELADFYKELMHLGSRFPVRSSAMTQTIATNLYKDVNNTCPDCLKVSVMKSIVRNALDIIYKYIAVLVKFKDSNLDLGYSDNVHDLKPNI